ncbi:MAG: hypothetical protein M1834_003904 [Cirrosporium novae-zelandiae]|nr:MAG: hypothetical protein M1834_003904 [Cirrosporium novae-zelandiae]
MNPGSSLNIPAASTSTIRPRARRLISIDDELSTFPSTRNGASSDYRDNDATLFPDRSRSPIPSRHPSRSTSASNFKNAAAGGIERPLGGLSLGDGRTSPSFASGLWESWSSLQSIASTVLGSDIQHEQKDKSKPKPNGTMKAFQRNQSSLRNHVHSNSNRPDNWGPAGLGDNQIGVGSKEETQALILARKREALLNSEDYTYPDSRGNYKRRMSDDIQAGPIPPSVDEDGDALIYVHKVKPEDTMAGILLKYACQPEAFRKANRMWPNDSIQTRRTVVLPVDACAVKGTPVPEPEPEPGPAFDLLEEELTGESIATPKQEQFSWDSTFKQNTPPSTNLSTSPFDLPLPPRSRRSSTALSSTISSRHTEDPSPPWTHDSWVQLPNQPSAVEIARLPRRSLGYFPPSRRKSVTFSDINTAPTNSLDLPRSQVRQFQQSHQRFRSHSPHPSSSSSHAYRSSISASASKTQPPTPSSLTSTPVSSSHLRRHHHNRSISLSLALTGPGGVGTLSGNRTPTPGPSQDSLNRFAEKHLPSLTLPKESNHDHNIEDLNTDMNIDIGSWVKKVAKRMTTANSRSRENSIIGGGAGNLSRYPHRREGEEEPVGDLIELDIAPGGCRELEVGLDYEHNLDARFPPPSLSGVGVGTGRGGAKAISVSASVSRRGSFSTSTSTKNKGKARLI